MKNKNKSHAVLDVVRKFVRENGYAPSYRQIAKQCGIVVSLVKFYLEQLERDGLIERDPRIARSLKITDSGRKRKKTDLSVFARDEIPAHSAYERSYLRYRVLPGMRNVFLGWEIRYHKKKNGAAWV